MPAGLIEEDGVLARSDLCCDFGEVEVHRLGVATRQDERRTFAFDRTNRAEYVGRGGALVVRRYGRVPRLAQRRVILFFCPMRASSANQISMSLGIDGLVSAISARRAGKVF